MLAFVMKFYVFGGFFFLLSNILLSEYVWMVLLRSLLVDWIYYGHNFDENVIINGKALKNLVG